MLLLGLDVRREELLAGRAAGADTDLLRGGELVKAVLGSELGVALMLGG